MIKLDAGSLTRSQLSMCSITRWMPWVSTQIGSATQSRLQYIMSNASLSLLLLRGSRRHLCDLGHVTLRPSPPSTDPGQGMMKDFVLCSAQVKRSQNLADLRLFVSSASLSAQAL